METWMSWIAIGISIVAIALEIKNSQKLNRINLEAVFYNEIFMECLIKNIPLARNGISFKDGYLNKNYKKLSQAVLELKKKMIYFKFRNKEFFDNVESQVNSLDEFLVIQSGNKIETIEQEKIKLEIDKRIHSLYECIFKEYNT